MAQARPNDGRSENVDLRQRETERRLIELRVENTVYRMLFFVATVMLSLYAMKYAEMYNHYVTMCKSNLSSLLV